MAILTRDELNGKLKELIGEDKSDTTIAFLEDVTDTLNDLESKASPDGKDWKAECEKVDKEWRDRYTARFFSSTEQAQSELRDFHSPVETNNEPDGADIEISDLFT